jgi:hypothetical protein
MFQVLRASPDDLGMERWFSNFGEPMLAQWSQKLGEVFLRQDHEFQAESTFYLRDFVARLPIRPNLG